MDMASYYEQHKTGDVYKNAYRFGISTCRTRQSLALVGVQAFSPGHKQDECQWGLRRLRGIRCWEWTQMGLHKDPDLSERLIAFSAFALMMSGELDKAALAVDSR